MAIGSYPAWVFLEAVAAEHMRKLNEDNAGMAELADAPALGVGEATRGGSTPSTCTFPTKEEYAWDAYDMDDELTRDDYPEFIRASGNCICPTCGKTYSKHPDEMKYLDWNGHPYLNKLCNGTLVKL